MKLKKNKNKKHFKEKVRIYYFRMKYIKNKYKLTISIDTFCLSIKRNLEL